MPNDTTDKNPVPDDNHLIKEVDITPGASFTANGKTYRVYDSFTVGRLEKVTLMEEELMLLGDQGSCHAIMLKAMEMINAYKPGDAYTLLYNKVESDRKNAKLMHYALRACTAYINYEGEQLGYLTDDQIIAKINDWSMEGLDVRPFIAFAAVVFKEHLAPYRQDMLNILKEAKSISEAAPVSMEQVTKTSKGSNGDQKQKRN